MELPETVPQQSPSQAMPFPKAMTAKKEGKAGTPRTMTMTRMMKTTMGTAGSRGMQTPVGTIKLNLRPGRSSQKTKN